MHACHAELTMIPSISSSSITRVAVRQNLGGSWRISSTIPDPVAPAPVPAPALDPADDDDDEEGDELIFSGWK